MIKYLFGLILSLLWLTYYFLPSEKTKNWSTNIGENWVYGYYAQTTGGDFTVIHNTVEGLLDREVLLSGNTPGKKYNINGGDYEVMTSNFLLKGKVTGTQIDHDLNEEFQIFNVEEYYLEKYVPRLWSNLSIFLLSGISVIIFTALLILKRVKNKT